MNVSNNFVGFSPASTTSPPPSSSSTHVRAQVCEPDLSGIADRIHDQCISQGLSEANIKTIAQYLVSKCSKDIGTQTYDKVLDYLLKNNKIISSNDLFGRVGDLGFSRFFDESTLLELAPELTFKEIEHIGVKNKISSAEVSNICAKHQGDITRTAREILIRIRTATGPYTSVRDFMLSLKKS